MHLQHHQNNGRERELDGNSVYSAIVASIHFDPPSYAHSLARFSTLPNTNGSQRRESKGTDVSPALRLHACPYLSTSSFKGEARTDLMCRLAQVLCIEGCAQAQNDALAEFDVVGEAGDAAVVDFGLNKTYVSVSKFRVNKLRKEEHCG